MISSENKKTKKRKKKLLISLCAVAAVIAILIAACAIYLSDYYHADIEAISAFSKRGDFDEKILDGDSIAFVPKNIRAGFIFYPGGKVEHTAYISLMRELASKDILCILVKMPFNLAVFDINAADDVRNLYPSVDKWYIGGHSLGGSMAASHLADNHTKYKGLVLLGAYSTENLRGKDLKVLSIYGSEDNVMSKDSYAENKNNLPKDFTEIVINGGCHAYFGMYGKQDGDGTPTISNSEQIVLTATYISELIDK